MYFFVDCFVSPATYEFYVCTNNNSNIIELTKADYIRNLLKNLLSEPPSDFKPIADNSNVLRFRLTRFNNDLPDIRKCNYLSLEAQKLIQRELEKLFKSIFHNYVLAYCRGGGYTTAAINDFCEVYRIRLENINFEMLKKSWDRSEQKKLYTEEKKMKKSLPHSVPKKITKN